MKTRLFLMSLLLILSCSKQKKSKSIKNIEYSIAIDKKDIFKEEKLSNIVEDIELIPLQTNDSIFIVDHSKVIVDSLYIYIADKAANSIYIFDQEGKIKTRINHTGRGPMEYHDIDDLCITDNGQIVILDTSSKKVIYYDLNGQAIFEQKIPFHADALEQLNERVLVFNGSSTEDRIILWDVDKERIINSFISYNIKYSGRVSKPLIKFGDKVFWQGEYSSSLINVSESGIETKRKIDFGQYNAKEPIPAPIGGYILSQEEAFLFNYAETDQLIWFGFQCETLSNLPFFALYSKKTQKQIILNMKHLDENVTYYTSPPQIKTVAPDGRLVSVLDSYILLNNLSKLKKLKKYKNNNSFDDFCEIVKEVKLDDNPIICLYKFKDF